MPRSLNQKLKPMYIARILLGQTDVNTALTAQGIIDALSAYGIPANRKSIYDDIEALRRYGLDIQIRRGKGGGYYIASRDFELPELKLLVDAVQSSRFITGRKSRELIQKLTNLTSAGQAKQLDRQVYINGRAKPLNDTVYSSIDAIHAAISGKKKISFKYFDYTISKKRAYRKYGEAYIRTPVAMCRNDDKSYLITYHPKYDDPFANYRVDRMASVEILNEDGDDYGHKAFSVQNYIRQAFGMYSGNVAHARLAFDESLVNAVIDHFGPDTIMSGIGGGRFAVDAEVSESPAFLAWMLQFGSKAEILGPASLRSAMRELISAVSDIYGEQ